MARHSTSVAKDPLTSAGWTSRCQTGGSAGARSWTGDRRLERLIHFGHGFKNFRVLFVRQKSYKIRFKLFFRDRKPLSKRTGYGIKGSCPDSFAAVASCSVIAKASYLSKSSSLLNPYWVILDRRAGTSVRLPASSSVLILAVSCSRRSF